VQSLPTHDGRERSPAREVKGENASLLHPSTTKRAETAAYSRTLDQQISKLRKRVEVDPADPRIIRTVHGSGYRFEA